MEERRELALSWLARQLDPIVYPVQIEFIDRYDVDYSGRIEGRVALESLFASKEDSAEVNLADYEVWIYSLASKQALEPVLPELQEKLSIRQDGTFESGWSAKGKKIARVVEKKSGLMVGTTEVTLYPLIRSYFVPTDDPMSRTGIARRSWLYDNALAVISFSLAADQERAESILKSLEKLQNADGSFGFAFDVYDGVLDETKRSGSIAWMGDAVVKYEAAFGDSSYRHMAEAIAAFLYTQQNPETGSIKGGPDTDWYSTEHNIDAYFFFRDFASLTGENQYAEIAKDIKQALLQHHWNEDEERFNQGIDDLAEALDANSWGAIFLQAIGREDLVELAINYIDTFKVENATMLSSSNLSTYNRAYSTNHPLMGYKPYGKGYDQPPSIVWTEGTWGVINLLMRENQPVDDLLHSMFAMQEADPFGGIVYSNERIAETPYQFYVWPAVASTAWQYITLENPRAIWDDKK
ncbi:hypothetical protein [Bacillus pinisoli]|uniref:hypothetical protein n=1 Tax=Bacillus pinisoli TaxID=2901866 RepID=UPI001FF228D4|nr:hypothetical protein [Bacillus pinisoli]